MNRQLTMNALILAAFILTSVLLFTYMALNRTPTHEVRPDPAPIEERSAPVDPYNVPAR